MYRFTYIKLHVQHKTDTKTVIYDVHRYTDVQHYKSINTAYRTVERCE